MEKCVPVYKTIPVRVILAPKMKMYGIIMYFSPHTKLVYCNSHLTLLPLLRENGHFLFRDNSIAKAVVIMFVYDFDKLSTCLYNIICTNLPPEVVQWLSARPPLIRGDKDNKQFNAAFAAMPRHTGKDQITLSEARNKELQVLRPGFSVSSWSVDRLSRVWLVLQLDASEKDKYVRAIEQLFTVGEMNEQVALYSALPLLAYPEAWRKRCAEGIRSNIGTVLESIMCNNPYPSEQLDEPAWNQMVLKAIFTEKPVNNIIGLDERANQDLANTLSDYAHERWAAHRAVHPLLWRNVGKFINERIFQDIERLVVSENVLEREAGALTCAASSYKPARELLIRNTVLKNGIEEGRVTWDTLSEKIENAKKSFA